MSTIENNNEVLIHVTIHAGDKIRWGKGQRVNPLRAIINSQPTRDARIALVGRASSQWSFQCAPSSLMII